MSEKKPEVLLVPYLSAKEDLSVLPLYVVKHKLRRKNWVQEWDKELERDKMDLFFNFPTCVFPETRSGENL